MTVSKLIEELRFLEEQYGDYEVVLHDMNGRLADIGDIKKISMHGLVLLDTRVFFQTEGEYKYDHMSEGERESRRFFSEGVMSELRDTLKAIQR